MNWPLLMHCKLVIMHKLYEIISRTWLRLLSTAGDVRARLSLKAAAWARLSMVQAFKSYQIAGVLGKFVHLRDAGFSLGDNRCHCPLVVRLDTGVWNRVLRSETRRICGQS